MAFEIKLNLKAFFQKEVKNLRTQYRKLLTLKQGINYDQAPHNGPATIARKGKDHWMKDTGELYDNGFVIEARKLGMTIRASKKHHSGRSTYMGVPGGHVGQKPGVRRPRTEKRTHVSQKKVTYEQLFEWHNQKDYSGIFKARPGLYGGTPKGSRLETDLNKEVVRQLKSQMMKMGNKRINLKVSL